MRPPTNERAILSRMWLFLLVLFCVACAVIACSSDDRAGSPGGLSLSLTGPPTCETPTGGGHREYWGVAEVAIDWKVTGGEEPYTLTIDGEAEDAAGRYDEAEGTASVSCALEFTDSFIHVAGDDRTRRYRSPPLVDSGVKTIRVVVTDATGESVEASIDVYVILALKGRTEPFRDGETYRLHGVLLTVPDDTFMVLDNLEDHVGATNLFALIIVEDENGSAADDSSWLAFIILEQKEGGTVERSRSVASDFADELEPKLDRLVASIGQLPAQHRQGDAGSTDLD